MNTKHFFAGLEEVLARLAAVSITIIMFAIFTFAKDNKTVLDTYQLAGYLSVFWAIYELLSWILFRAFIFFSGSKADKIEAKSNEMLDTDQN
jgi:hypothetical protein